MEVGKGGDGDTCNSINNKNKLKNLLKEVSPFFLRAIEICYKDWVIFRGVGLEEEVVEGITISLYHARLIRTCPEICLAPYQASSRPFPSHLSS